MKYKYSVLLPSGDSSPRYLHSGSFSGSQDTVLAPYNLSRPASPLERITNDGNRDTEKATSSTCRRTDELNERNYKLLTQATLFCQEQQISLSFGNKHRVKINVSGTIFETYDETLCSYPDTLLGDTRKRKDYFNMSKNEYFFDRDRRCFDSILFFYQSKGKLYRPNEIKLKLFEKECAFFQLPSENIYSIKAMEGSELLNELIQSSLRITFRNNSFKTKISSFLEHPGSSTMARYYHIWSFSLIILSVFICVMSSMIHKNETRPDYADPWLITEILLNIYFMLEFLLRMVVSSNIKVFLKQPLNIVDIIVVAPYLFTITFEKTHILINDALQALRMLRVFRLLHFSKHSSRMIAIGMILFDSLQDLQYFLLSVCIVVVFSGGIIYSIELSSDETLLTSIPECMWWAIQTFLTVGYGDLIPVTVAGKCFAALCMVFGVVGFSLPALTIIIKYMSYHSYQQTCQYDEDDCEGDSKVEH